MLGGAGSKEPAMQEMRVRSPGREEEDKATTTVLLPGESHGQKSLVGSSPKCSQEGGKTEQLSKHARHHFKDLPPGVHRFTFTCHVLFPLLLLNTL